MTGQVGGKNFSLHAEGERVILTREEGERQEVDLAAPDETQPVPEPVCPTGVVDSALPEEPEPAPGESPLDELLSTSEVPEGGDE